jgi:hypothetical protein
VATSSQSLPAPVFNCTFEPDTPDSLSVAIASSPGE